MSFILAGALGGLGQSLYDMGLQKRKEVLRQQEREEGLEDYKTKLEMQRDILGRGKVRGGRGGGGSGRGSGGALSQKQMDQEIYRGTQIFKDSGLPEDELSTYIKRLSDVIRGGHARTGQEAAGLVISSYDRGGPETVMEDRSAPMAWFEKVTGIGDGDGKKEVSTYRDPGWMGGGFNQASPATTTTPAPGGIVEVASVAEAASLPSGTKYKTKDDDRIRIAP